VGWDRASSAVGDCAARSRRSRGRCLHLLHGQDALLGGAVAVLMGPGQCRWREGVGEGATKVWGRGLTRWYSVAASVRGYNQDSIPTTLITG
jgi:hypothetical protein